MPATVKRAPKPKSKFVALPDAAKPWARVKPNGMHVFPSAIKKSTRDRLWKFFHPKTGAREGDKPGEGDFDWYQRFKRFPKTAHFNGWHSGRFVGEDGPSAFEAKYPELYSAAVEAIEHVKSSGDDMSDIPSWGNFRPESVAVMRHRPNWGLGNHYDNAHEPGVGMVLMLSISDDDTVPRTFKFTDPPRGRQFEVKTYDGQAVVFGGECYDEWQHESIRNPKQTSETISMTIRLAGVCGSRMRDGNGAIIPGSQFVPAPGAAGDAWRAPSSGGQYATGAPAALKVAHDRIRAKIAAASVPAAEA